jgi:LmbE family N-acetylglucosaminyl deacetylase
VTAARSTATSPTATSPDATPPDATCRTAAYPTAAALSAEALTVAPRAAVASQAWVVDETHPGTSEADWEVGTSQRRTPSLVLPDVDRVVVVAPHPDDEALGAGGLLQMLAARGAGIEVCAVTDGEAFTGPVSPEVAATLADLRTHESLVALGRLGVRVPDRARLGLPDGDVSAHESELTEYLAGRLGPRTLCLAPWPCDGHPDHDASGRAAAVAAAASGAPMLQYLVWAWHWADPHGDDLPWSACRRVELPRRVAAAKRWATGSFVSQTRPWGPGRPAILPPAVMRRFWRRWEMFVT